MDFTFIPVPEVSHKYMLVVKEKPEGKTSKNLSVESILFASVAVKIHVVS